ncbi:MAG: MarC family protein [Nanobdellota archaeon]
MISSLLSLVVILNPFAIFLYLNPVMEELDKKSFSSVLLRATGISWVILVLFLLVGNSIFQKILQIDFESFRIFGGIVIFSFAYLFIVKGNKAMIQMKETLNDLASEIALPFMAGIGAISLSIVFSDKFGFWIGLLIITFALAISHLIIMMLRVLKYSIKKKKFKTAFDKNMEILLRLTGFFVGAIGVDMIITGLFNLI